MLLLRGSHVGLSQELWSRSLVSHRASSLPREHTTMLLRRLLLSIVQNLNTENLSRPAENPMESSWLLVSLCLIGATCNAHKDPLNPDLVSGTDVFVSGTENYPTFRIPAALRLANGELLMFAEGRHGGDHGWNDIVMKRSSDGQKHEAPLH